MHGSARIEVRRVRVGAVQHIYHRGLGVRMDAGIGGRQLGERRHREQPLAARAQRRTAGHERGDTRAVREQLDQAGCGVGHLLEIVQQEQQLPFPQAALQHLQWRVVAGTGDCHCADDGGVGAVGLALGAQVNKKHAVFEAVDLTQIGWSVLGVT